MFAGRSVPPYRSFQALQSHPPPQGGEEDMPQDMRQDNRALTSCLRQWHRLRSLAVSPVRHLERGLCFSHHSPRRPKHWGRTHRTSLEALKPKVRVSDPRASGTGCHIKVISHLWPMGTECVIYEGDVEAEGKWKSRQTTVLLPYLPQSKT